MSKSTEPADCPQTAFIGASLLPAALAETPDALAAAWSQWRRTNDSLDHVSSLDYRLLPQVWRRLESDGVADPRAPVFRGVQKRVWTRNAMLLAEAAKLQDRLEVNGIPSLLMNGSSLLAGTYPQLSDRPSTDIDLLVDASAFRRAARLLQRDFTFRFCNRHAIAFKGHGPFSVNLHRHTSRQSEAGKAKGKGTVPIEAGMLSRRQSVQAGTTAVSVPEPTDRLYLHLSNVFARCVWISAEDTSWIADAHACVIAGGIDYSRLAQLMTAQNAVALFQHHFRALAPVTPASMEPLLNTVLRLPVTSSGMAVAKALSALEMRHQTLSDFDRLRAKWLALRGEQPSDAPLRQRLRFVFECGSDRAEAATFAPRTLGPVLRKTGHYVKRARSVLAG